MVLLFIFQLILKLIPFLFRYFLIIFQRILQLQYLTVKHLNLFIFSLITFTQDSMFLLQSIQLILLCHYNSFQRLDLSHNFRIVSLKLLNSWLGCVSQLDELLLLVFDFDYWLGKQLPGLLIAFSEIFDELIFPILKPLQFEFHPFYTI